MSDAAPPPFDPSKPFTQGVAPPPPFDPSKPFTPAGGQPKQPAQQGIGESLWQGLQNFGKGVAGGLAGEGVPAGKASEFSGGQSGFGGRMLGAGARSVGEGLWEAIKTPGQYASGEKQPGPQSPAEGLSTALLMAGQGGRRPIVPPRPEVPPPKPLLALPPPTVQVPGQAWTGTGVAPAEFSRAATGILERGNDPLMRSALEKLPQPGLVPPGPGSTMTAPTATPMMGQPARLGASTLRFEEPPLTSAAPTSPLADAIAKNDGTAIDKALTQTYRGAVKPKPLGSPGGLAGLTEQDRRITTAVDTILANKANLRVTDPATGQKVPLPARPNLMQFAESLNYTKRDIFRLYDDMAQAGNAGGVRVDLSPVIAKAREIERGVLAQDLSPIASSEAARLASIMESRGTYTPLQAQEMIEGINEISKSFWRGGAERRDTTAVGVLNQLAHVLRDQLDKSISTQGGPAYQALKTRYGSLRSVEQEVATAVMKLANKPAGGLPYQFADLFSAEQFIHGVLDPTHFARHATNAIATITGKRLLQYLRDPNRAIGRMFERRADRPLRQPYDRGAGAVGAFGAGVNDPDSRRGPMGGAIVGQRSIQRPASGYPSP